jgi:hypothetical protein
VPRAKRTDRAEARRRHRAHVTADAVATATAEDDGEDTTVDEPRSSPTAQERTTRPTRPAAPTERVGFVAAIRSAYQIADVRADLRALPTLLRGRAFLLPLALAVVSVIAGLASLNAPNTIVGLAVALFLGPLPIGSIYIASVFTPRAAYLMGGIAAFIGTLGLLVLLRAVGTPLEGTGPVDLIVVIVEYTIFGIIVGAGLGFYRRLLRNMNPGGRRSENRGKSAGKPAVRRR